MIDARFVSGFCLGMAVAIILFAGVFFFMEWRERKRRDKRYAALRKFNENAPSDKIIVPIGRDKNVLPFEKPRGDGSGGSAA